MPNLRPPITTVAAAQAYRQRIVAAAGSGFTPLMTAYLTDDVDADELAHGFAQGVFTACRLYPAHATTNADHVVTAIATIHHVSSYTHTPGMPSQICIITSKA